MIANSAPGWRSPVYLWPNLLSLDAPLVAVVWQGFAAECFGITIWWPARAALALAVWAVYIADRLLDTASGDADTHRHRFHREHRTLMYGLLATALGCAAGLALLQIKPILFVAGAIAGTIVLMYLGIVHGIEPLAHLPRPRWISKEAVVALVFTGGTLLAPWLRSETDRGLLVAAAVALWLLCWANVCLIEEFEWRTLRGRRAGEAPHPSTVWFAQTCGDAFALMAIAACVVPSRGLAVFLLAVAGAGALLLWLSAAERRVSPGMFRVLADAVLLTPVCARALL